MHRTVAAPLCLLLAGVAAAQELPDRVGVVTPIRSVFTTELSADDIDDYVFTGYPGMRLTARLGIAADVEIDIGAVRLRLFRPDGSRMNQDQGFESLFTSDDPTEVGLATLDATGTWKLRVVRLVNEPQTPVPYSLTLKTGKPRLPLVVLDAPDANRQFRFTIPAQGGARIRYRLTRTGAPLAFHSFLDPRGRPVEGFRGGTSVRSFRVPAGLPLGDYTLTFDASASRGTAALSRRVVPPKAGKRRVARLSKTEPVVQIDGVTPTSGGAGGVLEVRASNLIDPNAPQGAVGLSLGSSALSGVELLADGVTVRGTLPDDLAVGRYDVVVTSTSGQPAALLGAYERVSAPVVDSIEPSVGSTLGGFEIVVAGRNFRAGELRILLGGVVQPITPTLVDETSARFTAPPHATGPVSISVLDVGSKLVAPQTKPFEYVATPAIGRVTPPLVPLLGTDTITLDGVFFSPTDRVFFETGTPGVFEDLSLSQTTYVDASHHRFTAPLRPQGEYEVYVEDASGPASPRRSKSLTYFSFADATAASGLGALGTDAADATASALADLDHDGDLDLLLSRRGGPTAEASPQTRVLLNDGHAVFTDATAAWMPHAGADDWRAERVAAADIDGDGFVDLVLATNSLTVPPAGRSHTRILLNEVRGGTGDDAGDRLLRDRTAEVMAPVRTTTNVVGGGEHGPPYVSDDWRGLDVWVGDLDRTGAGPPEIVVTHDEQKSEIGAVTNPYPGTYYASGVYCGNYCNAPYADSNPHAFYWGGSRSFSWDRNARGGRGRYRFEPSTFPRASNDFSYAVAPVGGTFTPFTGKRLAVGDLDHDGRPDVAVLSDHPVVVNAQFASALQVELQTSSPGTGSPFTDVTPKLTALGYDLSGDTLALGVTGSPLGGVFGSIATAWTQRQPGRSFTLLRLAVQGGVASVEDVTYTAMPLPTADDGLEASQIRFVDVDQDGHQDLVLVAAAAPGGTQSALRVFRNEDAGGSARVFRRASDALTSPVVTAAEHIEGVALAIGDVTGDGLLDHLVTRESSQSPGSRTRILVTVK